MDREEQWDDGDDVMGASEEEDDEWDAQEEEDAAPEEEGEEEHVAPSRRGPGTVAQCAAPDQGGGSTAANATAHSFKYVYRSKQAPPGGRAWYGLINRSHKGQLITRRYHTPEEAARAVDRYLYKLKGPEACNFPVTPELAAELDALTAEQIQEQFRQQRVATHSSKFTGVNLNKLSQRWQARVSVTSREGRYKQLYLGASKTEEQAAERVSAGAYVLGDRCNTKVTLGRFSNLAPARGRALAVEVLGQAKVAQLEQLVRSGLAGTKATGKRRRARSEDEESSSSSSSDDESEEEDEGEEQEDRLGGVRTTPTAPAAAGLRASTRFAHVFWSTDTEPGQARATGQVVDGRGRLLRTRWYGDEEDAAHAVDRLIYKVKGPEACNFPVTPELAAELDALTVAQVQDELLSRVDNGASSRFKGVSFAKVTKRWQAYVLVKRGVGCTRQVHLGQRSTEEQAAERVRAAAYILGDRCGMATAGQRFQGLTPEQGRALAVEVLGQAKVEELEATVQGDGQEVDGSTAKRARADAGGAGGGGARSSAMGLQGAQRASMTAAEGGAATPRQSAAVRGGAVRKDEEGGAAACGRQVEDDAAEAHPHDPATAWSVDALLARARASITGDKVQDAWMDVREGFEAQQQQGASASAACGPIDVSLGTAPHPAVRAGVAGLSEAFQTPEAVAAAWAGAQVEAGAFAEQLGDEGLLDTSSLHRLTFLLAYSTLWLWQADELYQELPEPQRQAVLQRGSGGVL